MKKVLVLGVASVQMDALIELKNMRIETYACAQANDGPGSFEADHFELINFVDIEKVIEYIKENQIDCVYSVGSDLAMPVCTKISEILGLPQFVTSDIAKICNNKTKMRKYFGNNFIGNVRYQILEDSKAKINLKYPFIMKPADSQGQRGVHIIKNHEELVEHFNHSKSHSRTGVVIIEEYIDGPEISVNVYIVNGEIKFMIASDRIVWPQFDGGLVHNHIVPSTILNDEIKRNLKDLINRAVNMLDVKNGPLYFQIKVMNNQPYIIEVTPRLDGCHMWKVLKYYTGVNLLKLTFEHLLYHSTKELAKFKEDDSRYTLEFLCETPLIRANYSKFNIPSNALERFKYYNDGDLIKPVNGRFEKIGYFITQNR